MTSVRRSPSRDLVEAAPGIARAGGAEIDRVGDDREARLPEAADGARHVPGGGDEEPGLALARPHELAREDRILISRARTALDRDARRIDAERLGVAADEVGLGLAARIEKIAASRDDDFRRRVATREIPERDDALARIVERERIDLLGVVRAKPAAEHDEARDVLGQRAQLRKARLERRRQPIAERRQAAQRGGRRRRARR